MSRTTPDVSDDGRGQRAGLGGPIRTTAVAFGVAVVGFVVGALVLLPLLFVALSTGIVDPDAPGVPFFLVQVVSLQGIGFPLVSLAYLRWRGLDATFLRVRRPSLRDVGLAVAGLVGVFVLVSLSVQAIQLLDLPAAQRGDAELLRQPAVALAAIPVMLLIVGPGEELLFRGVIQTTLTERFSAPAAIVLANLAFAPAHLLVYLGTGTSASAVAVSLSVLFFPGLVFGVVYERSDNLVVPALSHGLYNAILAATLLLGPQEMQQGLLGL